MASQQIGLATGEQLEFWAARKNGVGNGVAISISQDSKVLWQAADIPGHHEHYCYVHGKAATVEVAWDSVSTEFGYAFSYRPDKVLSDGITLWQFGEEKIVRRSGKELAEWLRADGRRPKMHFSPPLYWMNDPNGLCKVGENWHLFYQFHPCGVDWGPMHWGHAVSKDLFNWTHLPVFLHPEANLPKLKADGGAFSGSAFNGPDGKAWFSYTERLPFYDENEFQEIQKIIAGEDLVIAGKARTVIDKPPPKAGPHFRDPRVLRLDDGSYRMVVGSVYDRIPAVLLYGSDDLENWEFLGPLYSVAPQYCQHCAEAIECPDFFQVEGRHVLVFNLYKHRDPESGLRNPVYAVIGDFDGNNFTPSGDRMQLLDFGTDFYAPQTFLAPEEGRTLMFAWLCNWTSDNNCNAGYTGELSLPRELTLNEDKTKLCMLPARELDRAWIATELTAGKGGVHAVGGAPFEVRLSGLTGAAAIKAYANTDESFSVAYDGSKLSIRLPEDDGTVDYSSAIENLADLRLFFDHGIIEVFANKGEVCGTRRSRMNMLPDKVVVEAEGKAGVFALTAKNCR